MNLLKKTAAGILFVALTGMLPGANIHAQKPSQVANATGAPLPKDVYPDSRTRLPLPRREDMDEEGKKIFDELARKSSDLPVGIEQPGVRFWDPKLAEATAGAGRYMKYETGIPNRLLEIAVLTAARSLDSQYEWTQWETHGRDPKDPRHIEPEIIDIIKYEKPVVGLGEKETAIIKFGRETFRDRYTTPETFAEVLRLFGRKGTVDVLWIMDDYSIAAAEMVAFDNQLRADQMPLLPPPPHARKWSVRPYSTEAPLPKDVYADSRNRLPVPRREDMDEEGKKIFDEVTRGKPKADGSVPEGFLPTGTPQPSVRLWDPQFALLLSKAGHYRKYETELSSRIEEIAVLTTGYEMGCQYEWTQWERFGRNPADPRHVEQSTIDIIKYNKPIVGLGEKETAVIKFGRETFGDQKTTPETFAEVLRLFGRKGTVDLLELMASYRAASYELTAFDQHLQVGQEPLLPVR
jgi:4-carboxymuconolactone decarboxylase